MVKTRKKEGFVAVYGGALKLIYLGIVIQKRWDESYYSTPAADEKVVIC